MPTDDFRRIPALRLHCSEATHPAKDITLRVANAIGDIAAESFGCLRQSGPSKWDRSASIIHLFRTIFLSAIELSGSARNRTGWQTDAPSRGGALVESLSVAPPATRNPIRRVNMSSTNGWADAYERAGGHYYPKLQVTVPFNAGKWAASAGAARCNRGHGA